MGKAFNCTHPGKYEAQACAACLADAYDLVDQARSILTHDWNKVDRTHQVVEWHRRYLALRTIFPEGFRLHIFDYTNVCMACGAHVADKASEKSCEPKEKPCSKV